jgi:hypothetical protein
MSKIFSEDVDVDGKILPSTSISSHPPSTLPSKLVWQKTPKYGMVIHHELL